MAQPASFTPMKNHQVLKLATMSFIISARKLYLLIDSIKSSVDGNVAGDGAGPGFTPAVNKAKEEAEAAAMIPPWSPPVDSRERIMWAICLPLKASAYCTMPNCRLEKWRSWFLASFFISMLWISIFSYIMVWMITIIGGSHFRSPFSFFLTTLPTVMIF